MFILHDHWMESMLITLTAYFLCSQILLLYYYITTREETATSLTVFPKSLSVLSYFKCQTSVWSLTPLTFCAESLFQTDWRSFLTSDLIQEGSLTLLKAKNFEFFRKTHKNQSQMSVKRQTNSTVVHYNGSIKWWGHMNNPTCWRVSFCWVNVYLLDFFSFA